MVCCGYIECVVLRCVVCCRYIEEDQEIAEVLGMKRE